MSTNRRTGDPHATARQAAPATTSLSAWRPRCRSRKFCEAWAQIPEEVLAELGYDLKIFEDPENRISYAIS